jgi:hypothetical protein
VGRRGKDSSPRAQTLLAELALWYHVCVFGSRSSLQCPLVAGIMGSVTRSPTKILDGLDTFPYLAEYR